MPILRNAQPFFFPGNDIGLLLAHGFTATPHVMRGLGARLAGQGWTVLGVRLAGHATHPLDMIPSRWGQWLASVEDGYHLLRGVCERVVLVGHSAGGALSFILAASLPVAGVVGLAVPYDLPPDRRLRPFRVLPFAVRLKIMALYGRVHPFITKGPTDWFDKEAARGYISYPDYPVRSVIEMRLLLLHMRATLDQVRVPVSLVYSQHDDFITPSHMEAIYARLGAATKEKHLVERSGHILPQDAERDRVFALVAAFVQQVQHPAEAAP